MQYSFTVCKEHLHLQSLSALLGFANAKGSPSNWVVGAASVLIRSEGLMQVLDAARTRVLRLNIVNAQRVARGFIHRMRFRLPTPRPPKRPTRTPLLTKTSFDTCSGRCSVFTTQRSKRKRHAFAQNLKPWRKKKRCHGG